MNDFLSVQFQLFSEQRHNFCIGTAAKYCLKILQSDSQIQQVNLPVIIIDLRKTIF